MPGITAAQKCLGLYSLQRPADYGVEGLTVLTWALILNMVWWLVPPKQYSGPPQDGMDVGTKEISSDKKKTGEGVGLA